MNRILFISIVSMTSYGCSNINTNVDEKRSINDMVYTGPVLRAQAEKVIPQSKETQELIDLLIAKANTGNNAVGLAAPQLGIRKSVFIYRVPNITNGIPEFPRTWEVALNPSYSPISKEVTLMSEGCFSVPHFYSKSVPRYKEISFRYQSINGDWHETIVNGYKSQILQHETDHLNGILYINKIQPKNLRLLLKK
ncbi:peptide deformylase [Vibrio coralliirubri]|uniref:peptide deformylase n=1 Tax=Vibrio coralliirubri TaxID=1516159 RepID=UPI00063A4331|nr:peptide deformylase [Vibrio coralliirubri]CDT20203.1 putative Peptide deformylase [Vibrio coralliirubri]CDT60442.1 putative Peptide deformylase [Vibrio coralliirubri]CDT78909.1 putative Peptide deformylase [Vibrio coralliirubri]CDT91675.1 putative Peptide deformylase [Vibrio coralliirubri]CDU14418.1 putative Peptide deformylase [Vibrio coralliirubri]